jgi:hypothetical protein
MYQRFGEDFSIHLQDICKESSKLVLSAAFLFQLCDRERTWGEEEFEETIEETREVEKNHQEVKKVGWKA